MSTVRKLNCPGVELGEKISGTTGGTPLNLLKNSHEVTVTIDSDDNGIPFEIAKCAKSVDGICKAGNGDASCIFQNKSMSHLKQFIELSPKNLPK